jgi:heterodisulfide reductase subunit D
MDDFNIILFLCNWGPHTAFQELQDKDRNIPTEINMIRIPCTGRISKSLLFKAFEMGADGVALVGCEPGTCRYGSGTDTARLNTEDTRDILELLGIGKERMRWVTFLPDEAERLLQFLKDFVDEIRLLGSSPVRPIHKVQFDSEPCVPVKEIVAAHDVFACQDCGKCSSACPLALIGKPFSPRALVNAVLSDSIETPAVAKDIWSCLTCGICYERCPSAVNFPEFIRDIRHFVKKKKKNGHEAHGGFFQSLIRAMTAPGLKAKRWDWLPEDIHLDPESKILFYGGCAPYFDTFFRNHHQVETCKIIADSLRLLNFFDIQPTLLQNERCCGHDLLWSGDKDSFLQLAVLNVDAIHKLGIEEVITACPECYRMLKYDYPQHGVAINFSVTHLYEFLEKEIDKGAVNFKKINKMITFQDSCRLNRIESETDLARKLIGRLKPDNFMEMRDNGSAAICCGNCAWTGCDAFSKSLQVKRLQQAQATGSDLLVTACPKCQIHLKCAMEDPFLDEALKIEMTDLTGIIAKTIYWE